ncbi:heme lyase CcmF/NrfE family subunit [Allohahella marinimesophila]|uniref:Heme lyase CcmF/NrfE family subunit n=1 Tax=Allohahella marinimesophila TaxID=1054972 RepID=A0ABP7NMA2_9GAMM
MIPEAGHFALILALCVSVLLSLVPLAGTYLKVPLWQQSARPLAVVNGALLLLSFAALTHAFLTDDFSVVYAASHSNSLMPWYFKFSAVWGGHEGSLLLWVLILSFWTAAVALLSRQLPLELKARVLSVLGMINVGFLLFILLTSNPFERYLPNSPTDGADLNPLLQDFGLIVHPPLLYMGYVGFSVAFAFAIAALLGGRLDATWARWSRPWTTVAWAFLTLGIALGSWWAYYELGWGGWWFWDPVENASFMPWLAGTALMHSLAATEKRGVFKSWTVLLAIFTFSLCLLGTFLVRSGILTSVHAFANDPERGRFVLMMLGVVIGGSLLLYALRAPVIKSRVHFTETSRESFLLANNIILFVASLTVLGGTLFPLAAEFYDYEVSVGAPYFNLMFAFLTPLLAIALGFGARSRWKTTSSARLLDKTVIHAAISFVAAVIIPWLYGEFFFLAMVGVFIAAWVSCATVSDIREKTRNKGLWRGWQQTSRSYKGMIFGHIGLAVMIMGAAIVSHYTVERNVRLAPGEAAVFGDFLVTFDRMEKVRGPNYIGDAATFDVFPAPGETAALAGLSPAALKMKYVGEGAEPLFELKPEKRRYVVSSSLMTEAGINPGLFRDIYISLGEPLGSGEKEQAWAVRLQYKPLVRWLWLGAIFMALGGGLAVSDRRYRLKIRQRIDRSPGEPAITPSSDVDASVLKPIAPRSGA